MNNGQARHDASHFLIIGGGSAAFAAAIEAHGLGARVTLINDGLPIGGTCVNVGCVPSKTLLRAAEAHHLGSRDRFAGIETTSRLTDFRRVIEQKRELVTSLRQAKYHRPIERLEGLEIIAGRARFVSLREVEVAGRRIAADHILIAAGSSPALPDIPGLDQVDYLTNESAFELEELPESMLVIGAGYVGLECAQLFARFGTKVTVLSRTQLLSDQTADVREGLKAYLSEEGIEICTETTITKIETSPAGVTMDVVHGGAVRRISAQHVLVTAGRQPNTIGLGTENAGVILGPHSEVTVDAYLQTTAPGIFAAGDIIGSPSFVYTAAYEGKLAARNALSEGEPRAVHYAPLPWVVFTDPQLAGVGLDEVQAALQGFEPETTTLSMSEVPRAIVARDTRGFIKLIRDKRTNRLLGGRILAPEGGELLMELAMAIRNEMSAGELIDMLHPYLTLSEGIRLAALTFDQDVSMLSCCAG